MKSRPGNATSGATRGGRSRSGLAFICACLAVAVALPSLLLVNVGRELLQPGLYKDALVAQNVYQRLPTLAAQQIVYASGSASASDRAFIANLIDSASGQPGSCVEAALGPSAYADLRSSSRPPTPAELDQIKACVRASGAPSTVSQTVDGMPVFFWLLTTSDWNGVLTALLPPDWARIQAESAIDQAGAMVESGQIEPVVEISMAEVKTRVAGPEGLAAVERTIQAQPSCSLDQLGKIVTIATSGAPLSQVPICRPPDAVVSLMGPSIQSALTILAGLLPDTAEVDISGTSGGPNPLQPVHDLLDLTRGAAWAGIGLAVLLLLAAALLGARSAGSALRWLGVPLAVAGALGIGLAVAGRVVAQGFAIDRLPGALNGAGEAPALAAVEVDTFNWIGAAFFGQLEIEAAAILAVGLATVGASLVAGWLARRVGPSRINARSQPES